MVNSSDPLPLLLLIAWSVSFFGLAIITQYIYDSLRDQSPQEDETDETHV